MRLHLVTTIPQVDGGTRYLLMCDANAAREWADEIRRDPAMIDGGQPDYAIDAYPDGTRFAMRHPGSTVTPEEWQAIRAAL